MTEKAKAHAKDQAGAGTTAPMITVFREDFSALKVGAMPHDYSPLGEYHLRIPEGMSRRWIETTLHPSWRGDASWNVLPEGDAKVLEQSTVRSTAMPTIAAGDPTWTDVVIKASFRPLATYGPMGVLFRYRTSRQHYALWYTGEEIQLVRVDDEERAVLDRAPAKLETDRYYTVEISAVGSALSASVAGGTGVSNAVGGTGTASTSLITLSATDSRYPAGKIGFAANAPVRYKYIEVSMSAADYEAWRAGERKRGGRRSRKEAAFPAPKLWRRIPTPGFGAGKSIRFGDLDGDGRLEMLLAQNVRRMSGDNFSEISCLTVLDLDGRILWQQGEPNPANALVTNDLPMQIHDIDGDGREEVVVCRNFELQVLDGRTGRLKYSAPTPLAPEHRSRRLKEDRFARIVGDSISFCDLAGRGRPQEILVKDRYNNAWAYTHDLKPLWHYPGNVGHFPMFYDIDGDGKDEVFIGYTLIDHDGAVLWELPVGDHADGVAVGKFGPGDDIRVIIAASDEGMLWVRPDGSIERNVRVGHSQTVTVANLVPERPGYEVATVTFWGNPGIIVIFDPSGEILYREEVTAPWGTALSPVNWDGSGQELLLLSGHPSLGGMMDGTGDVVVRFPDDGHPYLCYEPVDLVGDARDEIVLWDADEIWIYTQDDAGVRDTAGRVFQPVRRAHFNMSNYRAQLSLRAPDPQWRSG